MPYAAPPQPASSVTWIPTYTRSLAKRRAARVTFKPNPIPGRTSLLPGPPQRFGKRSREPETEQGPLDTGGTGRAAGRRRTLQGEQVSKQAKELAQHILDAVSQIAQRRDSLPEQAGMRALSAPRTPPAENPLALTERAWEGLTSVELPDTRQTPQLSHLTPCTSVQAELAKRQHEQRVAAATPAPPQRLAAAEGTGGVDGFSFPAAQAVTDLLRAPQRDGRSAGEQVPAGQRAALDVFGMMAGPSRTMMPSMTIAQAQQQRRDEEAAAEKRRVEALPEMPAKPSFEPPQLGGADVMPKLDAFVQSRRQAGLGSQTNPCDFLKPLPGEEEQASPATSPATAVPEPVPTASAPVPAATVPVTAAAVAKPPAPAPTAVPMAQPATKPPQAEKERERAEDDRPAKRRAPVASGWGDAFLQSNKADGAAAKEAIAKEIADKNPLATKPPGQSVSFGSGMTLYVGHHGLSGVTAAHSLSSFWVIFSCISLLPNVVVRTSPVFPPCSYIVVWHHPHSLLRHTQHSCSTTCDVTP